ncbi:MAG: hypothetical protein DRR06_11575 [Gammaproteobacteria bacterium]|nr:MAG: hypothetical protein DRR06_11575 [Gammaproteobacteria bacterium]RLA45271.1 MAG: hypothetical protein DRR42_19575 [Gammaproteobacteria bacterium]
MNWEIVGAIAEIAGVVTVVATIIFLAVEVRNTRNATEAASIDTLATGFNTLHAHIITDPEFAKTWMTGLAGLDEIDDVGRMQVGLQMQSYLNHYIALRKHYESGLLPKKDLEPYSIGMAAFMNSPGGRRLRSDFFLPPAIDDDIEEYKDQSAQYEWLISAENEIES